MDSFVMLVIRLLVFFCKNFFAGDLQVSQTTSGGGVLCIFGERAFVPVSWMCKKHTVVSHRSTEA